MSDRETEAALVALLRTMTDDDDPAIADRAIDLYLTRFGDDQGARLAAVKRLSQAMLAGPDPVSAAEDAPARSASSLRRPR